MGKYAKDRSDMVKITDVAPHSRAQKAGIVPGDTLVSINGREINDVLDYRFYLADTVIDICVIHDGEKAVRKIVKREYDDIGLDFETALMDKKHSCENKCVFCFIDQLPKGMRQSLYFKDDDSRLSFLHGNYITLTNLHDRDIDRIIEMHISPVNISVHTTNPELRIRMMHNKRAGEVLGYIDRLAEAGISLCCQIVLCRGLNDGEELERTMRDLEKYYPALKSTSIVPAGLTKYREKLYELKTFSPEESAAVIKQVNSFGQKCVEKYGTRLFYCADELYIKAGLELPGSEYYEEFSQIENGVGMVTEFESEIKDELGYIEEYTKDFKAPRRVSVATGYAAYEYIKGVCDEVVHRVDGLEVNVYRIKNEFFGEQITVAGLLTGTDLKAQLFGRELGDELIFPAAALRAEGDMFLDDITPEQLSAALGVPVRPADNDGAGFIKCLLGL